MSTTQVSGAVAAQGRRSGVMHVVRDLRIGIKITAVLGVLLLVALVIGFTGYSAVRSLGGVRDAEVGREVPYLQALYTIRLTAKSMANDERGALLTGEASYGEEVAKRESKLQDTIATAGRLAPAGQARQQFDQGVEQLRAWTTVVDQVLKLRATNPAAATQLALTKSRDLRKVYEDTFDEVTTEAEKSLTRGTEFHDGVKRSQTTLVVTVGVGVLLALLAGWVLIRNIVPRLKRQAETLSAVATGDLTVSVPDSSRDEIGAMAAALNTATGSVGEVVQAIRLNATDLAAAAAQLTATSHAIAASADESAAQAGVVSAAAEQVSRNSQTVAAGTEEMSASIREIAHQATSAAGVAAQAVGVATATNATMAKLNESSTEIGNVIKVITSIAEQTNLLALNATIEAARAGEAGKGFAVVAGEVKELAQETSKATDDIGRRIETIQADTEAAVAAIGEITEIITRINDTQVTIASAVEEQTATTNEMSRNVAEAATGSGEIAQNITVMAQSAADTSGSASATLVATEQLRRMSTELEEQVSRFRV
ncbi:MAG: methyl-accepting chemotaxis protein [Angustibacter sp.]